MTKWISLAIVAACTNAVAADTTQVGHCMAYAFASGRTQAGYDAYGLAENPRVAIATAKQSMEKMRRARDRTEMDVLVYGYAADCRKIGIRMTDYR